MHAPPLPASVGRVHTVARSALDCEILCYPPDKYLRKMMLPLRLARGRCGRRPAGVAVAGASTGERASAATRRLVAHRRMLHNEEIGSGLAPDGRGRWAVDSVLEWRGGEVEREVLV